MMLYGILPELDFFKEAISLEAQIQLKVLADLRNTANHIMVIINLIR